jgi:hypothetical protein
MLDRRPQRRQLGAHGHRLMARDFTRSAMLKARAAHDAAQRAEQLAQLAAEPKPDPQTLMSFEHAEMLAEVHGYRDGEQIGRLAAGGTSQVLTFEHGLVVAEPQAVPRRRRTTRRNPVSWSSQSERQIQARDRA